MKIFGADFSGAKDPSKGIYYAEGFLKGASLIIEQVKHCDDRLDLLCAIHFSKAPWGLDFPFALPKNAQESLNIMCWDKLLEKVVTYSRGDFEHIINESGIPPFEARCKEQSICCRVADASSNAFSALKKNNPNMRVMTYAGLKLLSYLRNLGNRVYPFDRLDQETSRLYEVYPAHTWNKAGLPRTRFLKQFANNFNKKYDFKVELNDHILTVDSPDAADAVVACVTLGYVLFKYELETDWSKQYSWISNDEWDSRYEEGLIVKVV